MTDTLVPPAAMPDPVQRTADAQGLPVAVLVSATTVRTHTGLTAASDASYSSCRAGHTDLARQVAAAYPQRPRPCASVSR
ncbi:hypothetical protein [Kitasatospora sp. NPDC088779]|uniref:hypothetical protein n=1 Tax=unclassified Kitasatospora TaxID=2633591 RepID=UPI0034197395